MILLPRAQLPVIVQREDDRSVVECAFAEKHRLMAVVQTNPEGGHFHTGCVGKIIHFQDGAHFYFTLGGLCRFTIEHIFKDEAINKASVCYKGYEKDLEITKTDPFVDRPRLLTLLKDYLDDQEIAANWEEIDHASDDLILNSLSMACPFDPVEKQALLEMPSLAERCDLVMALMEKSSPHIKRQPFILH
jgi:Lon protease-like protein